MRYAGERAKDSGADFPLLETITAGHIVVARFFLYGQAEFWPNFGGVFQIMGEFLERETCSSLGRAVKI